MSLRPVVFPRAVTARERPAAAASRMARVLLTQCPDLHLGGDVGTHLVAFLEVTKPRITQLVVLTAAAGFYLGSRDGADVGLLVRTLIGVRLAAAGTTARRPGRRPDGC